MAFTVEPLNKGHDRKPFQCGQPDLDDWFQHRASRDDKRNVARVFVASNDEHGVIGFYCLSSFTLTIGDLPDEIGRKLPHYEAIPAALIGRLARDIRVHGKGIGELLLADVVRRIISASRTLAVFAIVVEAKDAAASAFYEGFGFRPFPQHPRRLFLLTSTASTAVERL